MAEALVLCPARRNSLLIMAVLFFFAAVLPRQGVSSAPRPLDQVCAGVPDLLSRPADAMSKTLGSPHVAKATAIGAAKLVEDRLIDSLLDWIAANTDYDVSQTRREKPSVSFCDFADHLDYEDKDIIVETEFRGLYDKAARHIYLVAPWSPDDVMNVGTLLHELIHDVQLLNRDWPCWGRAEWQAYKLQETWLKERGLDPEFSWLKIFMITRCRQNMHP